MRRLSPPLVLLLLGLMLPASAGGGVDARSAGHAAAGHFYFGRIAFEDDVIGIALGRGNRAKVFVTDAEPGGDAEWFEGRLVRSELRLRSASGRARLRATFDRGAKTRSGTISSAAAGRVGSPHSMPTAVLASTTSGSTAGGAIAAGRQPGSGCARAALGGCWPARSPSRGVSAGASR